MKVSILWKDWSFVRTNCKDWGTCDKPWQKYKKITVSTKAKGKTELDAIIHECTHAACDLLSEDMVTEVSSCLASVLWAMGYRKKSKPKPENHRDLMDVCLIHLRLHLPFFCENSIVKYSHDLAKILSRLGYQI